jgi:hypothetical protein
MRPEAIMSDSAAGSRPDADTEDLMAKIDTTVPVSARIWNYWMGGTDYFPVDKAAGDEYAAVFPGIFDLARTSRAFIIRTVTYLAAEAGIRQFLDIGTGLPSHDNTHEIVQRVAPESRVVYVDRDPMVIAHARALLASNPAGNTDYIDGDVNDPGSILSSAREKLDFSQPVAIMLMGMLGHVGNPAEDDDAYTRGIVATLTAALPSGGYLALNEAVDNDQSANEALDGYNQTGAGPGARIRSSASSTAWNSSIPVSSSSRPGGPSRARPGRRRFRLWAVSAGNAEGRRRRWRRSSGSARLSPRSDPASPRLLAAFCARPAARPPAGTPGGSTLPVAGFPAPGRRCCGRGLAR